MIYTYERIIAHYRKEIEKNIILYTEIQVYKYNITNKNLYN